MPINPHNPFKGRQYPGEVIVLGFVAKFWEEAIQASTRLLS